MKYGKIILGDNQFLGVNHANQLKAADSYNKFKDTDSMISVIDCAYKSGINDFMFTTHDKYSELFKEIYRSNLFPGMHYTPCIPYAHKYWNKISDQGLINSLYSTVSRVNFCAVAPALLSLILGKLGGIIEILTTIEIMMVKGLPIRGVFLQNLAFDLLMAFELYGIIEIYSEVVMNKLGVIPGFITMNHPMAVNVLTNKIGLSNPWLCANYNKSGFRMNPAPIECRRSFELRKSRNIAMSVFASGLACPDAALDFVLKDMQKNIVDSILFGSSSCDNIKKNTVKIFNAIN